MITSTTMLYLIELFRGDVVVKIDFLEENEQLLCLTKANIIASILCKRVSPTQFSENEYSSATLLWGEKNHWQAGRGRQPWERSKASG